LKVLTEDQVKKKALIIHSSKHKRQASKHNSMISMTRPMRTKKLQLKYKANWGNYVKHL